MRDLDKTRVFQQLHQAQDLFIMPNCWDEGSARILQSKGFKALGTTSAGLAYSMGVSDGESAVNLRTTLENVRRICEAVSIPVSVDFENGFAHDTHALVDNVLAVADAGAAGCSIEDWGCDESIGSYARDTAIGRIEAVVTAVEKSVPGFVLTARSDMLLHDGAGAWDEVLARAAAFQEAGAHCIYVPGIRRQSQLDALVAAVSAPLNVLLGVTGLEFGLQQCREAGVRRLSVGGSLMRYGLAAVESAAAAIREGDFSYVDGAISDASLTGLFKQA